MVFVLINAHFLPTSIPLNTSQLKNKMVSQAYLSGLYSKILISQDTAYTSPFLSACYWWKAAMPASALE